MDNKELIETLNSYSDHLTNNREDYYKIPNNKLKDLCGIYNKNKAILISWDDKHQKIDVNSVDINIDDITLKKIERLLKITKINNL